MAYGGYSKYVDLGFKPDREKYLIAKFYIEPAKGSNMFRACEAVAAESSIGTWTRLSTMRERVLRRLQARAFKIGRNGMVEIAYPIEVFEGGNAPQILSDIAGNIFGMKEVKNIRLVDFEAPKKYLETFPGPAFGVEGVRRLIGTTKNRRPHLGTIIKPKIGLTPRENARVGYESWSGGLDFIKDDENLTHHKFSPFEDRVIRMLETLDKVKSQTGRKGAYAPNITAPTGIMLKRAEFVKEHGGTCIMIDILTAGFSSLQYMRNQKLGMFIHAHRAMHAAFGRNPKHGIAMRVVAKLSRMCGVDQLHIGGIVGKMEGKKEEIVQIHKDMNNPWGKYRPVFSVCSGGLSPLSIPKIVKILGTDCVIQAGGGVHGHPDGSRAGAMAMVQATEATIAGIPISSYAKKHKELAAALKKWGNK